MFPLLCWVRARPRQSVRHWNVVRLHVPRHLGYYANPACGELDERLYLAGSEARLKDSRDSRASADFHDRLEIAKLWGDLRERSDLGTGD